MPWRCSNSKQHSNALAIPTEAISNPKDPVVYVINANNEIEARPVKLGVEMPDKYEVTDGLKEGELVMVGSASQVHPGQKVEPKLVQPMPEPCHDRTRRLENPRQ